MRLASFQVERFRSIMEPLTVDLPGQFLALSGPNNSGKSNLLRALNLLFNRQTEPGEAYSWQRDFPVQLQHERDASSTQQGERETVVEATFELRPEDDRRFIERVEGSRGLEDQLRTDTVRFRSRFGERGRRNFIIGVRRTPLTGDLADWFFQALRRKIAYVYVPAQKDMRALIGDDVLPAITEATRDAWGAGPDFARLRNQFRDVADELTQTYEEMMESAAGSIQGDFDLLDEDLTAAFTVRGTEEPLTPSFLVDDGVSTDLLRKGAGTQNRVIVFLLDYIAYKRYVTSRSEKTQTVFALEEPESFVHPGAQGKLAAALRVIADKHQMLITTHSVNLLDPDHPSSNVLLDRSATRDLLMTRLVDTGPGHELLPFRELLGDWAIAPDLDSRYVVLIEGKLDKQYLERFCEEFTKRGTNPLRVGAQFYQVGTKDALKMHAKFVSLFGVRFFIVADGDCEPDLRPKLEAEEWEEGTHFAFVGTHREGEMCTIEGLLYPEVKQDYLSTVGGGQLTLDVQAYHQQVLEGGDKTPPVNAGLVKNTFQRFVLEHIHDYEFARLAELLAAIESGFDAQDSASG